MKSRSMYLGLLIGAALLALAMLTACQAAPEEAAPAEEEVAEEEEAAEAVEPEEEEAAEEEEAVVEEEEAEEEMAEGPDKIALILTGRVNDPGYFNAGYLSLLAAGEHYGAETIYQENLQAVDAEQVLRTYGEEGVDYVIVMGGGNFDDQILNVVPDYPDMKFIIVSGRIAEPPQIASIFTGHPGVAYLGGVLMAEMSETNKIGLIGGRATPPAILDHVAIIAGAQSVNPDIEVFDVYTETYTEPAVGKEAAIAQIEQGVDIIFTNANNTSFGVFEAAEERGVLAVGAATDQNEVAPDTVLTSTAYGMDIGVLWVMEMGENGEWGDETYTMDLSQVDLAPFHSLDGQVSQETKDLLAETKQQLIDGEITIPQTYEEIGVEGPAS